MVAREQPQTRSFILFFKILEMRLAVCMDNIVAGEATVWLNVREDGVIGQGMTVLRGGKDISGCWGLNQAPALAQPPPPLIWILISIYTPLSRSFNASFLTSLHSLCLILYRFGIPACLKMTYIYVLYVQHRFQLSLSAFAL